MVPRIVMCYVPAMSTPSGALPLAGLGGARDGTKSGNIVRKMVPQGTDPRPRPAWESHLAGLRYSGEGCLLRLESRSR